MADLADENTQQLLRTIVREETASIHVTLRRELRTELRADLRQDMRTIVKEETADIRNDLRKIVHEETADIRTELRTIVREETADIRDDVKIIKHVQGQQSVTLRMVQTDVNSLKTTYRVQAKEVHKLGVLLEDLDHRFQAAGELD